MLALLGSSTPAAAGPGATASPGLASPEPANPRRGPIPRHPVLTRPVPRRAGPTIAGDRPRGGSQEGETAELPPILPRPQGLGRNGEPLSVPRQVRVLVADADRPTTDLVVSTLKAAGAAQVDVHDLARPAPGKAQLTVLVGPAADEPVANALRAAGGDLPGDLPAEGYALASRAAPDGGVGRAGRSGP